MSTPPTPEERAKTATLEIRPLLIHPNDQRFIDAVVSAVAQQIREAEEAVRVAYQQLLADALANTVPAVEVLDAIDKERARVLRLVDATILYGDFCAAEQQGSSEFGNLMRWVKALRAAIESGAEEL